MTLMRFSLRTGASCGRLRRGHGFVHTNLGVRLSRTFARRDDSGEGDVTERERAEAKPINAGSHRLPPLAGELINQNRFASAINMNAKERIWSFSASVTPFDSGSPAATRYSLATAAKIAPTQSSSRA